MSLVVWLPLTKDLRNQGLSNVTVTNNGATFNSAGKLGGCYSLDGTSINIGKPLSSPCTAFTVAGWVNLLNGFTANNGFHLLSFGQIYGRVCVSKDGAALQTLMPSNVGGTTGSPCPSNMVDTAIVAGIWHHYIVTYNAGLIKIYIDGVLDKEYNTGISSFTYTNNIIIGTYSAESCKGLLNDYRLYDHALSPMEVKELSKGLVLHYPLNRQGWGQENLLKNTDFNGIAQKYTLPSGSEGGFTYTPSVTIPANTTYTVSCRMRGSANMTLYKLCTGGNESVPWVNKSGLSTTEYKPISITFTSPGSSKTLNQIYICTRYGNSSVGDWFEIAPNSLKMELGSKATPWCPNSNDTLYDTMGLNGATEYDCSGFCNNGSKGGSTISYTSDTPKYTVSTQLTGTTVDTTSNTKTGAAYITGPCSLSNITALTVSWWAKIKQYGRGGIMDLTAFTSNFEEGTDYNTCPLSNWDSTFRLWDGTNAFNFFSYVLKDSQWHHYVVTFTSGSGKFYRDGVNIANSGTMGNTLTNFNGIRTGLGKAGGVYRQIKEDISDIRIYATALSASDVKSLYQNSAYIDSSGNVYGAVHSEV